MNYYRVLYNNEYAKKNGRYGIVDTSGNINEYLLEDGLTFPFELLTGIEFFWVGSVKKEFADFQMMYYGWRLISEKMHLILDKFSSPDIYYHPIKVDSKEYGSKNYSLMHFLNKKDVIDKKLTGESLMHPRINTSQLTNIDIFVYKEFDPSVFCVSELVKQTLESNHITGCFYQKIS